jgi:hypothetical protein
MVGIINKFITDKTKIYFKAYKVDGHIFRERERYTVYVHWRKIKHLFVRALETDR